MAFLLALPMCGNQEPEPTPPPMAEPAALPDETLTMEEQKAVTSEFDIEAEEAIDEENLEQEVAKIEAELNAES